MKLSIRAQLDYYFSHPTDVLLQLEAAALPEQVIEQAHINLSETAHFARIISHDNVGERLWLRVDGRFTVDYTATIAINRVLTDYSVLARIPPHRLPSETVQYLLPSRYCPSDQFQTFVDGRFGHLQGGQLVKSIHDWVASSLTYVPGSSTSATTALETFVKRQGICRDYAHVMITLVRACGIPARIASVYALGVKPQDFHAVAEVFLGGEWHLIDATGMAHEAAMAKIGVGRDAADVAFLTAYGNAIMNSQSVMVTA